MVISFFAVVVVAIALAVDSLKSVQSSTYMCMKVKVALFPHYYIHNELCSYSFTSFINSYIFSESVESCGRYTSDSNTSEILVFGGVPFYDDLAMQCVRDNNLGKVCLCVTSDSSIPAECYEYKLTKIKGVDCNDVLETYPFLLLGSVIGACLCIALSCAFSIAGCVTISDCSGEDSRRDRESRSRGHDDSSSDLQSSVSSVTSVNIG